MRAIAILVILAVAGFFGYQYAVEGRGPVAAVGVLTGATAAAEAAAAEAAAAEAEAAAAAEAAAEAEAAAAEVQAAAEAAAAEVQAAADAAAAELEAAAAEAAAAVEAAGVLTAEGFDAEQLRAQIQDADISELEKTALVAALDAALNNPELLQPLLDRLNEVLGQ